MNLLELKGVGKHYGNVHALRDVSLDISSGETIAIIGPSGCGKTTLLRCIALLDYIDSGGIHLDGVPVVTRRGDGALCLHATARAYRLGVGMIFQHLHLWPHLTVLQQMVLAPVLTRKLDAGPARDRAKQLLQKMGVAEKADAFPSTLSAGQQQRVAIARALMVEPRILLLDEITSSLDSERVGDVLNLMRDLASGERTMVVVTHELQFAREAASRIVFMDNGTVVEEGDAHALLAAPNSTRLRDFLSRISGRGH